MPGYGNINSWPQTKTNSMSIWSSVAQGASGLLGGIMNEAFSDKHLKDAQNFSLMQGDIDWQRQRDAFNLTNQRDDEVWNRQKQYNMDMWNMQNDYNSPTAQMNRFKEAGLNPHLIYGQSNAGGSIATANLDSASMQGTSGHSPVQAKGADWSFLGSTLADINQLRLQSAQVDNVKAATEATRERAGVDRIRSAAIAAGLPGITGRAKFDAYKGDNVSALLQQQVDALNYRNYKMYNDVQIGLNRDTRSEDMQKALLKKLGVDTEAAGYKRDLLKLRYGYESEGQPFDILLQRYGGEILKMLHDYLIKD